MYKYVPTYARMSTVHHACSRALDSVTPLQMYTHTRKALGPRNMLLYIRGHGFQTRMYTYKCTCGVQLLTNPNPVTCGGTSPTAADT